VPTAQPLRTGDPQRLGAYELSGRLGEGGQGVVYLGRTEGDDDTYAVKLLHGSLGDETTAFLREVELAKQVARFCTAQVREAGFDEGRPYIVSEYIDGPSLQREVALTGPRRGAGLERLAVSTATALAAIHSAGIVHRDFKPQNVLLGADGPRVIDFGLARALDAAATVSGRGVGTPAYMAPEQITASAVTGAADVFSWGATMCFAANASAPFGQDSVAPVLHRILTAAPELGKLDGRLRALVEACLDKDARNRPTSRELLFALLGDSGAAPAEVLRSPPPHIIRAVAPATPATPAAPGGPPAAATPLAQPESTGALDGYRFMGSPAGSGPSVTGVSGGPVPEPGDAFTLEVAARQQATKRAMRRAALAVVGAVAVTVAVLATLVVPALTNGGRQSSEAGEMGSPSASSPASAARSAVSPAEPEHQSAGNRPPTSDPLPAGPLLVQVPSLAGLDRAAAAKAVARAGFTLGSIVSVDSAEKIGRVVGSRPAAGVSARKGTPVALQVSAGVAVPEVTGLQRAAAQSALTGAGLKVGAVTTLCSAQSSGQVLSSKPEAGRRVSGGAAVSLVVARAGAEVPSVVGQSRPGARAALRSAGFVVAVKTQIVTDQSQVNAVLEQSLAAGSCAKAGDVVTLTVGVEGQTGPDPGEPSDPPPSTTEPSESPEG
jgi:beta-lactam-binding protein with PASTA domain/predicted Ser/Thr protein kinase